MDKSTDIIVANAALHYTVQPTIAEKQKSNVIKHFSHKMLLIFCKHMQY